VSERRHGYTTVGHVTIDVLPDGTRQPGGSAFYSALQAARLGLRARIVTRGDPNELEALLAAFLGELELSVAPAAHTTTLQTIGEGRARRQQVLSWAAPIAAPTVDTAILHLAPIARETPRAWEGVTDFVGLTPQGLVREWDAADEITLAPLRAEQLPERCDAWVLSERERPLCATQLDRAVAADTVVAVTDGPQPVTLHQLSGKLLHVHVPTVASARDDLGAGDVFAAAFFVALHERQSATRAVAFANAAAALRIAGRGPGAIADRAAIEARMLKYARPTAR
jgi:1D-myo-inositol 3-kinase